MGFLVFLIIGGLAGLLAAKIVEGKGLGILGNILVGWVGAGLANFIFGTNIELSDPTLLGFILSALGSVVLLLIVNLFFRRDRV